MKIETECIDLYGKKIEPCHACRVCQTDWEAFSCVYQDDMDLIFDRIQRSDLILLATPIYSWYCTPPMKAVLDRLIYGACKYYGQERGPSLMKGKKVASLVTCGYRPEHGADLWEEGLKRWCKHGQMDYVGLLARRHMGYSVRYMDEEKAQAARVFAHDLYVQIKTEEL